MNVILVLIIAATSLRCFGGEDVLYPKDITRKMPDGSITLCNGLDGKNGWVNFEGKVLEVQSGGIRIQGAFAGEPASGVSYGYIRLDGNDLGNEKEFFVAHFPYDVAEGDWIGDNRQTKTFYMAKEAGTYTYSTVLGGSRTIRKLEYGTPYTPPPLPPPTPEQIAAAKSKAVADKKTNEEKGLKYNQELAAKGDPYGLFRMGERYRDGDGVPKDLAKARDYFTKAVAAGSPSAADELSRLDRSTNAPSGTSGPVP